MLPQFMPNAKIILLLMVMFANALCSTRDYVIMLKSANHNKALHITPGGKVSAADISKAQNITIGSIGDFLTTGIFKITLYSKEAGRYLCFNKHWKLVGMKNPKGSCHFIESLDRGYFEFRSAVNRSRRVGFNRRFRPVVLQREQHLADACFHFMKIEAENFDQNDFAATEKKSAVTTTTTTTQTHQKRRNNQRNNKTNSTNGHNSTLSTNGDGTSINHNSNNLSQTNKQTNSSGSLKPKILVRHHHNNISIVARRRQHQREQKIRQRRKKMQNKNTALSSTNISAKSSSTMLAPAVLNIVATLAASRRTRGRRKSDDIHEEDEEDSDDSAVKQKKVIRTSSITESTPMYLSPNNPEHRHHHLHQHHQIANDHPNCFNSYDADLSISGEQIKSTATSGLQQKILNQYSNKIRKTVSKINNKNNYLAIPALPKKLYSKNKNNRMTEYVYSGSTNIINNLNFNKNNDRISSKSSSKEMNINNNLNIDNNFKDYLNTTKDKNNANRKNLFEAIKNNNNKNKTKNIVQYRYAVSFISMKYSPLWF